ncbi:MAG: elongation factor G [Ilumatobacteraceae bacterium]
MEAIPTQRIRNVVLVGHNGCGKTTLVEALLHRAGVTTRVGRVEDGTAVTGTDPEEVKRGMSLSLGVAPFEWKASDGETYKINLLDAPGYADFVGEEEAAMSVADLAILVVSAVDGIEVGTELAWERCVANKLPRLVFVNKDDKQRANFHNVLSALQSKWGHGFAALELPLGEEESLHGVADVLSDQAFEYDNDGRHHSAPIPNEIADEEHRVHDELVEEIVSGDDDQLERYLSGDVPTAAELERSLAHEVLDCLEFPVLVGSALTGVGVDRLADFICEIGPAPSDRPMSVIAGTEQIEVAADASAQPLGYVFKTLADQFVGQVSLCKVVSGTISPDERLIASNSSSEERLHALFYLRGKEQLPCTKAVAGDIIAVAKLSNTTTGATLAPRNMPVRVVGYRPPPPVFGIALKPLTQTDDDKLSGALQRLVAEDPSLSVDRNHAHQTVLSGAGDTHLAVALERLARKFGVRVDTEDVKVPYRETVVGTGDAEGKVKKQSGGHGQYAVANLRVSPLERGAGFEFVDSVVGGAIPRNFMGAVQKGVEEAMTTGGAHGFPVVDVRVECYDGKYHSVDSSDMAFKNAAALGFKEALGRAGAVVLEPISLLKVTIPSSYQGDVLADLTTRRGRVVGTSAGEHGEQEVSALVPTSELIRYALDLRSLTAGRGRFVATHDHDEILPNNLVSKVKAAQLKGSPGGGGSAGSAAAR